MALGGLTVTVIGISTVFAALASLNVMVRVLARTSAPRAEAAPVPTPTSESMTETGADKNAEAAAPAAEAEPEAEVVEDLTLVAVAAFALHRRHRIDVGSARPATQWVNAGRTRAMVGFKR